MTSPHAEATTTSHFEKHSGLECFQAFAAPTMSCFLVEGSIRLPKDVWLPGDGLWPSEARHPDIRHRPEFWLSPRSIVVAPISSAAGNYQLVQAAAVEETFWHNALACLGDCPLHPAGGLDDEYSSGAGNRVSDAHVGRLSSSAGYRANLHSCKRRLPRRRSQQRNCPVRIRCANSIPASVILAVLNVFNPSIGAQRRLSAAAVVCSITLLTYRLLRTRTDFHLLSSPFSRRARCVAACPSTLILLGQGVSTLFTATRKNACAASMVRLAQSNESTELPCLSTVLYKKHLPPRTGTEVSSIRHEIGLWLGVSRPAPLASPARSARPSAVIVVWDTTTPCSAIMARRSR